MSQRIIRPPGRPARGLVPLALFCLALAAPIARADFTFESNLAEPMGDTTKLFLNSGSGSTGFSGQVGGQSASFPLVNALANTNVNVASGWSTVKPDITPIKDGTLNSITFTPLNSDAFGNFTFRAQLQVPMGSSTTSGSITVTVQDNLGDPPQSHTFTGLSFDQDIARLGIDSFPTDEAIKSVTISTSGDVTFKEVKQITFGPEGVPGPPAVPEPASAVLLGLGLALTGAYRLRNRKS